MNSIKNVAIYARVSLTQQDVSRQLYELRQLAKFNGWNVVEEYVDEGFSRITTSRPALDKLVLDCVKRKFDTVITLELSRLGTNLKHLVETVDFFKKHSVNLFVKNQAIDTSSITGYMFFSILVSIQNYERELLSERIKSKLQMLKSQGVKLGRKSNLTDEVKSKVIELSNKGISPTKIARQFKIGVSTCYKVIKENDNVLCKSISEELTANQLSY